MLRTEGRSLRERPVDMTRGSGMVKLRAVMLLRLRICDWSSTDCMRATCVATNVYWVLSYGEAPVQALRLHA